MMRAINILGELIQKREFSIMEEKENALKTHYLTHLAGRHSCCTFSTSILSDDAFFYQNINQGGNRNPKKFRGSELRYVLIGPTPA